MTKIGVIKMIDNHL